MNKEEIKAFPDFKKSLRSLLTCPIRNDKRSPWDWNERTLDGTLKTKQEIKNTGKGNYIDKYKSQYYHTCGL